MSPYNRINLLALHMRSGKPHPTIRGFGHIGGGVGGNGEVHTPLYHTHDSQFSEFTYLVDFPSRAFSLFSNLLPLCMFKDKNRYCYFDHLQ